MMGGRRQGSSSTSWASPSLTASAQVRVAPSAPPRTPSAGGGASRFCVFDANRNSLRPLHDCHWYKLTLDSVFGSDGGPLS